MIGMCFLWSFKRDEKGASAAEFALVLPLFLLFLFGIIDVGLYGWKFNKDEKATQIGARMAVVTDVVASGLATENYVGKSVGGVTLTQGDVIPASALGLITCNSTTCTCTTAPCPSTVGYNGTSFNRIVSRMQDFDPQIQASNVLIEYRGSGLGYAGDPNGMEISPLTTVRLRNMSYNPLTLLLFGGSINLPSCAYTLTMEDGSGTFSN